VYFGSIAVEAIEMPFFHCNGPRHGALKNAVPTNGPHNPQNLPFPMRDLDHYVINTVLWADNTPVAA